MREQIENSENNHLDEKQPMTVKRAAYIFVGCIGVALGFVGWILPMLPAFPFLLVAAICFGKSSEKLDRWFKGTKMYKENLETFLNHEGMTWPAKIRVMTMITILMTIGTIIMYVQEVPIYAFITLGIVWLFHMVFFIFFVKKYEGPKDTAEAVSEAKADMPKTEKAE